MALKFRLGALSFALAIALAACGGSGGGTKTAAPSSADATTAVTTATAVKSVAAATAVRTPPPAATSAVPPPTATAPAAVSTPVPPTLAPATEPPGAAPTVIVGAVPNATMQYYDLTGTSVAQLRASMDAQGPVDSSGRRNDAFTTWNIDWTWPLTGDGACILSGATITDTITVTFPRWLPTTAAPASLIVRWNTYESALVTHESGHVSFVVATAADVLAAIKGATCATAEAAAQAVVTRIRQHDVDYDTETDHGATQGARFP
jgi:predicted secreted Zn-dependent protease